MNTQSIYQQQLFNPPSAGPQGPASAMNRYARLATMIFAAFVVCLVLFTGTIWAVMEPDIFIYFQAISWCTGFVFLAIAFEEQRQSTALMALATGIAIQLITGLSAHFTPGLIILTTPLIAAWLTMAIVRR